MLKVEHHEPREVYEYYRAADLCFVSSLHDGMNLVAKEFVAARDDERGVLILSQFTGAARELPEALIVNPYDADQCAAALHVALTMPPAEQRDRMRLMRGLVRRVQRVSLGRAHAARCRQHAPARAPAGQAESNVHSCARAADPRRSEAGNICRQDNGYAQENRHAMRASGPPLPEGGPIFLDVDGTLLEIADTPTAVRVDRAVAGAGCSACIEAAAAPWR